MTLDQYINHLEMHYRRQLDFQDNWDVLVKSIDPEKLAHDLGLIYVIESTEINLCYGGSKEIRPEFRQSFFRSDISDYIYAVVYSPSYKTQYENSERSNIPKIPYPSNAESFWQLVKLGAAMRELHALQDMAAQQCAEMNKIIAENKQSREDTRN